MTAGPLQSLVVGDLADPHVQAVVDRLPRQGCVVLDAATVTDVARRIGIDGADLVDLDGHPCTTATGAEGADRPVGWIRRLAPAGWDDGARLGGHPAAVLAARLGALATIVRDPAIRWITDVDAMFAAEGKMTQYRAAARLGIPVPPAVVATTTGALERLAEPFVVKPLGPGGYRDDDGRQLVVHAQTATRAGMSRHDVAAAPFIAQERVHAHTHLRVVTVGDRSWTAALRAGGRPLDWREDPASHDAFRPDPHPEVEERAVAVAAALRCGYTSQDWIVDTTGRVWFLDLNPAGQWLFLSDPIPGHVADRLAQALAP